MNWKTWVPFTLICFHQKAGQKPRASAMLVVSILKRLSCAGAGVNKKGAGKEPFRFFAVEND